MPRNYYRNRSSSIGSQYDVTAIAAENHSMDSINNNMTSEDVEIARRLLSSILYLKDNFGRSFLHTKFDLGWAKCLLDRAKSLDECSENILFWDVRKMHHHTNNGKTGNCNNKQSKRESSGKSNTRSTLLQSHFLLQPDEESGYTPLHRAIVEGNLAATLLLLRHAIDTESTGRFPQRPMTALQGAEAYANIHGNNKSSGIASCDDDKTNRSNNLLHRMATAGDKEGLTPLRLLGMLQRSELSKCRKAIQSNAPQVDQRATRRLRPRQSSFSDHDDEGLDFFSENGDLLQTTAEEEDENGKGPAGGQASYACEVVTFGRPHHCALGVVQGVSASGGSTSISKDNCQYSHASTFSTHRVQDFAQEVVGRDGSAIAIAAATHHTLVVTKNGHLYAFGLGKGGRLGLGDDQLQQCPLPTRVLGPLQRRRVVNVAAAENHSLCVTEEGNVFSWGSNRFGQLGDSNVHVSSGSRSLPRRVDDLKQIPCVAVAAGERHSVALSRKGEVYVWGDNACGQLGIPRRSGIQKVQRVESLWKSSSVSKIAIAIAAAEQSTLVLTAASATGTSHVNSVYEWGHGNHVPIRVHFETARPKSGNSSGSISRQERVVNPTAIACGKYHNVALTSEGLVYTWGLHAESLGRSSKSNSVNQQQRRNSSPELVSGLRSENGGGLAVAIAASDQRTAVVCDNGALFTWGTTDGKNILGHEGVRWQHLPRQVPGVHRAIDVAIAKEHTVLLIGASFPSIPPEDGVPNLEQIAARSAANHVDLFNVIPILIMAERSQCEFLSDFCREFVRRNLDGVLNAGKKSVMNQYLNDMLSDTSHAFLKNFRDDHHHPFVFDVLSTGKEGLPSFSRDWLSSLDQWTRGCVEFAQAPLVQKLLALTDAKEHEKDVALITSKPGRSSSSCSDGVEQKFRIRSLSGGEILEPKHSKQHEGRLDACIRKTANMDLSTAQSANENSVWLMKEIRGVRKKLKRISHLMDSQSRSIVLTTEEEEKVRRRPVLEAELNVYVFAMEEVEKRLKDLLVQGTKSQSLQGTVNRRPDEKSTAEVSFGDPQEVGVENHKHEESVDSSKDPSKESKTNAVFFCELCRVSCSDESNLVLHQNGRKHRNKATQAVEAEKKEIAASLLEQQQRSEMRDPKMPSPSQKIAPRNAWGVTSTPPKFKLSPPPHPVVPQVTPVSSKRVVSDHATPCLPVNNREAVLASPASNFQKLLHDRHIDCPTTLNYAGNTNFTAIWDTSPGSSRCVPLSVYAATDPNSTPLKRGTVSLANFISPTSGPTSTHSAMTSTVPPWTNSNTLKQAKSLRQIQVEETNLKEREDKFSGSSRGRWFVESRERASSLLEIQQDAKQKQEERLLVEEQLMIEAQIKKENERLQKEKDKSSRSKPKRKKNKGLSSGPRRHQTKL